MSRYSTAELLVMATLEPQEHPFGLGMLKIRTLTKRVYLQRKRTGYNVVRVQAPVDGDWDTIETYSGDTGEDYEEFREFT